MSSLSEDTKCNSVSLLGDSSYSYLIYHSTLKKYKKTYSEHFSKILPEYT